eukprot:CAMPEP_0115060794 /NCGR_PEP_ID=MMETSP0227-20121206/7653_1 /TAXON_ID=89957 /ORGANISM="Polarella glacialis, Strain CCMP 1383" /LENGTH=68 /DNA_ID=CAMNT_0002446031 /DNA_START=573 /DNA_END=776 /DNA_ORIENTATION=+
MVGPESPGAKSTVYYASAKQLDSAAVGWVGLAPWFFVTPISTWLTCGRRHDLLHALLEAPHALLDRPL